MSIPYLPESSSKGVQYLQMQVTPKIAEAWLRHNGGNRGYSRVRALKTKSLMERKEWVTEASHISFSKDRLIDGQHRLGAVSMMDDDFTLLMGIFINVPELAQSFMDCGWTRTLAQRSGYDKDTAAIANWMWALSTKGHTELTPRGIELIVDRHPNAFDWVSDWPTTRGLCRTQIKVASMFIYKHNTQLADDFRRSLFSDDPIVELGFEHPSRALRKKVIEWKLTKKMPPQIELYQYSMAAARATVEGRTLSKLYRNTEPYSWL